MMAELQPHFIRAMNLKKTIARLGLSNVARLMGVSPQAVHNWRTRDVLPLSRVEELERVTDGLFSRVDQWPRHWRSMWPDYGKAPQKKVVAFIKGGPGAVRPQRGGAATASAPTVRGKAAATAPRRR